MNSSSIPEKDAVVIKKLETLLCPFFELLCNWKQEKVISIERIFSTCQHEREAKIARKVYLYCLGETTEDSE
jgi:hypothetical protein